MCFGDTHCIGRYSLFGIEKEECIHLNKTLRYFNCIILLYTFRYCEAHYNDAFQSSLNPFNFQRRLTILTE